MGVIISQWGVRRGSIAWISEGMMTLKALILASGKDAAFNASLESSSRYCKHRSLLKAAIDTPNPN